MNFLNPDKILRQLNITPEMSVADFGCGSGEFTMPLARLIKRGRVNAVDIQKSPLLVLEERAKMEKLITLKTLVADLEKGVPQISSNSLDYVFLVNVLFQVENKQVVINEAYRVLQPGDYLVIIDWYKKIGQGENIVSQEGIKKMAYASGFSLVENLDAGEYHFGLLFKKP